MTTAVRPPLDLSALPPTLDIRSAARLLGIGKSAAYELIRTDQFPVPVLRLSGRLVRIPTVPLLSLLGLDRQAADLP